MKSVYERTKFIITEFDTEDVITTSGIVPDPTEPTKPESSDKENRYGSYDSFDLNPPPGGWF